MKILVVEDEKKISDALSHGLSVLGYTIDVINDGDSALERITLYHEDYDIVLLDLKLPNKDGFTICQEVRKKDITIPIIILTSVDTVESKVQLLRSGADDYLPKPFSFEELDARIQAILRRPTKSLPPLISVQDIELNPSERTAFRNGEELNLTLKEFSLLEYFMRNPDRVIQREELLSSLWDFNYTSFFSNALEVHIKNLRRKIDGNTTPSRIETVRGIGYRLRK